MTIQEEENWVMARRNPRHGLEPLKKACAAAGNPQDKLKVIHVAGTNGKGSVCKALHDILKAHGYKVGLFTSPHLTDHRDRMRMNDNWISEEEFHAYLQRFMPLILENNLGMFEIDCLIAFTWFYEQKVDYAVIECGLGGRLDNTNIIACPVLSVITTVSYDHMQILGSRIEQIAFEKAGILHAGLPAVCGLFRQPVQQVIERHAQRLHCPLHSRRKYRSTEKDQFIYRDDCYQMGTEVQYQKDNLSLALEAAWTLGIDIHDEETHQAVRSFQWAGRFETIRQDPLVILDGAHNEEGMRALIVSARSLKRPLTIVFSALKDKPGRKMASAYAKVADKLVITCFENDRADSLEDLYVPGAEIEKDWQKAVNDAVKENPQGSILITGSLYFVSLVRNSFAKSKTEIR